MSASADEEGIHQMRNHRAKSSTRGGGFCLCSRGFNRRGFWVSTAGFFCGLGRSHFFVDGRSHFCGLGRSHFCGLGRSHFWVDGRSHFFVDGRSHFWFLGDRIFGCMGDRIFGFWAIAKPAIAYNLLVQNDDPLLMLP